uniref:Uncharacterized protein n=1 Tax=Hyaloperonospora arabidopsidis (strain Emoy2) TaxID=559515 RepID=M4BE32_HYAAE
MSRLLGPPDIEKNEIGHSENEERGDESLLTSKAGALLSHWYAHSKFARPEWTDISTGATVTVMADNLHSENMLWFLLQGEGETKRRERRDRKGRRRDRREQSGRQLPTSWNIRK